jgi:hypothetical protein
MKVAGLEVAVAKKEQAFAVWDACEEAWRCDFENAVAEAKAEFAWRNYQQACVIVFEMKK